MDFLGCSCNAVTRRWRVTCNIQVAAQLVWWQDFFATTMLHVTAEKVTCKNNAVTFVTSQTRAFRFLVRHFATIPVTPQCYMLQLGGVAVAVAERSGKMLLFSMLHVTNIIIAPPAWHYVPICNIVVIIHNRLICKGFLANSPPSRVHVTISNMISNMDYKKS